MTTVCAACGTEPARDPDRGLWLTYNGEVYNFRELRGEMEKRGHCFRTRTDSEVLIHLYAEMGISMLSRLNGIFAFALYDGRPSGQRDGLQPGDLFLARDGLGVKPLYYSLTPSGFVFGSEIKALLRCAEVPRALDYAALHSYLTYLWSPAPRTMLEGVKKVPPGHAQIVRDGRIEREWAFYDLPYRQTWLEGSEIEIAAKLRDQVEAAVSRQMVADVPVGAFLSGGLDSSAVVAMMRRARPDYVPPCYSIGFAGELDGAPSDLPYAKRVAAFLGVDLRPIEIKPDAIGDLERMLYFLDEPQADPAPINVIRIAEQARRDGVKVLLSGAGGDDLFSGYRRHVALRLERLWAWLPYWMRRTVARLAQGNGTDSEFTFCRQRPWGRRISRALMHADLTPDERLVAYFYWGSEGLRRSLYSEDVARQLEDYDTAEPLRETLKHISRERDPLNRMLYLEAKHFLTDHNLNYTDKMGMAAGVEIRVPLLDPDLVALAARIPPRMKQKGVVGKAIFKKAMEPLLPQDVIYRPKTGFGAPLRRWLTYELRDLVEEVLSPSAIKRRGLFDHHAVGQLVRRDRAGVIDGSYTVFSLMCIELWCRIFLDRLTVTETVRP